MMGGYDWLERIFKKLLLKTRINKNDKLTKNSDGLTSFEVKALNAGMELEIFCWIDVQAAILKHF